MTEKLQKLAEDILPPVQNPVNSEEDINRNKTTLTLSDSIECLTPLKTSTSLKNSTNKKKMSKEQPKRKPIHSRLGKKPFQSRSSEYKTKRFIHNQNKKSNFYKKTKEEIPPPSWQNQKKVHVPSASQVIYQPSFSSAIQPFAMSNQWFQYASVFVKILYHRDKFMSFYTHMCIQHRLH